MNAKRMLWPVPCLFAACLSSQPAAPPARVFDPRPVATAAAANRAAGPMVRVEAPAHLGVDFVLRTATDEVVFDGEHRWLMPPVELVVASLQRRLGPAAVAGTQAAREIGELHLVLERFELDVAGEPMARIVLVARPGSGRVAGAFTVERPARDRSAPALCEAMRQALAAVGDWAAGG